MSGELADKDWLLIEGLEVEASIGVFDWEKRVRQRLLIDLKAETDFSRAANSDDIAKVVSYADLCEAITSLILSQHHDLLEFLAHRICETLFDSFDLKALELTVWKPKAVAAAKNIGIRVSRRR